MNTSVAILAAGLGTRMRSKRAKVLHRAAGLALVEHVVGAARSLAEPDNTIVVTGHQAADVEALLRPAGVKFVRQEPPRGTGHALECCRAALENVPGLLMVLYGDTPLLSAITLQRLREEQERSGAAATLITTTLDDPSGYGRVIVDALGNVEAIVEQKDCTDQQRAIQVINSGIYCFRADLLWRHLGEVQPNPISGEYYLTDMARILREHGHAVRAMHIDDPAELLGINTRVELADADRILRERKTRELMLSGVTIERPETVCIDASVSIGTDTVIEPFTRLLGRTRVGEDCRIGAGSILENSDLADRVLVGPYTLIADSRIEAGANIGPFARLRMGAHAEADTRIGNFVELKNTRLGAGAKSQHLAYLGDSQIGAGSNIGAGTITCNYDGEKKHATTIGEGVFVGSNSTLVAPVVIGADSYLAAGSVITEEVPSGALAVGRGRQVNKPGWVAKRRGKKS
ncbi:MAG TPA: bifunctional UDP-N-acetylglucosamine diphosphorylase/glucosamine-1-phosphate N-acetyltransferase GlmU [Bryobacteraceae bacterium]|jgi:bifunctional UDP-N-acetylglucosamine pyrophosphorylase/glucosamine-1-phosphate N-acetyltransferase